MIFCLVGESASGKSTIERRLSDINEVTRIVSFTTRPMRALEIDGKDYHFVTEEEFKELQSKNYFSEVARYREWWYGLSLKNIDYKNSPCIAVVTPKGYREIVEKAGEEYVRSIYIGVNERERITRLAHRGDDVDEIIRRIHTDRIDFADFDKEANFIIENIDVDKSVEMVYTIIKCLNK
jgi:guanylate kinase